MSVKSKPDWIVDYPDYEQIVRSWGWTIAANKTFGMYQGDEVYVLRDGERCGLVVIGYGSCSGCDELDAVAPWGDDGDWSEVIALSDRLRSEVHWEPSTDDLRRWIDVNPENDWWQFDSEIRDWIVRALGGPNA